MDRKLGRGLNVLIPKDFDESILQEDKNRVQKLLISDVIPNPEQPRRDFEEKALGELTESIKRHGVLQPIIVIRHGDGYRIVAGERRWRAAASAELKHIPAIVRSLKELEQLELSLIENIQRVDLSPLEQALSIQRLQQQFSLNLEQIAAKLGKATSTLSNLTRLLKLPDNAREALIDGVISEGHARAILALQHQPAKQAELLELILDKKWTVRQAEQFAVAAKKGADSAKARSQTASQSELTQNLARIIKAPVSIKHTARGGQLVIAFSSDKDLERIARQLGAFKKIIS